MKLKFSFPRTTDFVIGSAFVSCTSFNMYPPEKNFYFVLYLGKRVLMLRLFKPVSEMPNYSSKEMQ